MTSSKSKWRKRGQEEKWEDRFGGGKGVVVWGRRQGGMKEGEEKRREEGTGRERHRS